MSNPRDEIRNLIEDMQKLFPGKAKHKSFDEIDISDDRLPADGAETLIPMVIGMRGQLNRNAARYAAKTWHKAIHRFPKAIIMLVVSGYDDDPREIWDIEEARAYVRAWAHAAGINTYSDARLTPLDKWGCAFLAKCGAFKDVEPDDVTVRHVTPGG